jgi:hypothetical protein
MKHLKKYALVIFILLLAVVLIVSVMLVFDTHIKNLETIREPP